MDNLTLYKDDYCISTDRSKLDVDAIHNFLSTQSYWCQNIPFEKVKKSVDNSLNFGLYYKDQQIGFARIISDFSTMAYLGDVYVIPEHRGKGLSKWMMQVIMSHPELQGIPPNLLYWCTDTMMYNQSIRLSSGTVVLSNP